MRHNYFLFILLVIATNCEQGFCDLFWKGRSAGWAIEWSSIQISAKSLHGKKSYILWSQDDWTDIPVPDPACHQERRAKLLSVVGPFVSIQTHVIERCGEGTLPENHRTWQTFDLSKKAKTVQVTALFSEENLKHAFLQHPLVQESLKKLELKKPPRDLSSLVSGFNRMTLIYEVQNQECYISLERLLSAFTIEEKQKANFVIRFSLEPEGIPECQSKPAELLIEARPKPQWSLALNKASQRREGALYHYFNELSRESVGSR